MTFDATTLTIIGAAVAVLALVLALLAFTGRKPHEGPQLGQPIAPDQPLPEPEAAPGLPTAELVATPAVMLVDGPPDELTRLKGLGPRAAALLNGMGYTRYDQIAAWSEADAARVDAGMGAFQGRIVRDRWIEQARFLAEHDVAGFEERFGKIG